MGGPDPTVIMLDQIVRVVLIEGIKAIVWVGVAVVAARWFLRD